MTAEDAETAKNLTDDILYLRSSPTRLMMMPKRKQKYSQSVQLTFSPTIEDSVSRLPKRVLRRVTQHINPSLVET
jgi:hypothetical protein